MADFNGQMMGQQQYGIDMGDSQNGIQRMQSSLQQPQQQSHMIPGQMHQQQRIMMQSNHNMHIASATNMQVHQMGSPMRLPQMMSQQNLSMMNHPGQIQQNVGGQSTLIRAPHQMMIANQLSPQQPQTQMVVTSMGQQQQMIASMGPQVQQHLAHQMSPQIQHGQHQLNCQPQQVQQHQMIASGVQGLQQQSQHSMNSAQQAIVQSPGFVHPNHHVQTPNPNYQQASPHRQIMNRYPTPSPESISSSTSLYHHSPIQRPTSTPRLAGHSSAIRQALGHTSSSTVSLSSAPSCTSEKSVVQISSGKLLKKDAMETLIKTVDPTEAVEDDVSDALMQLVEEFVDDIVVHTTRVAKHRNAREVEAKDVEYVLEKRYNMHLPSRGGSLTARNRYMRSPASEGHRQRMSLIKKTIHKP